VLQAFYPRLVVPRHFGRNLGVQAQLKDSNSNKKKADEKNRVHAKRKKKQKFP
jgi:hypothetical protein